MSARPSIPHSLRAPGFGLALAAVLGCAPGAACAAGGPWLSFGLLSGSTSADAGLADYQWSTAPRAAWGAQALAGLGRWSAGLRGWRASSVQSAGAEAAPAVRWTSLELVGRTRLAVLGGQELLAGASVGRMHLGWSPDRMSIDAGGTPVEVEFRPVDEWIGGAGLGLRRPLGDRWAVGVDVDRRLFALDTAHRNGAAIEYGRERFGDWSARVELAWLHSVR